jgi:hypothetical protein
MRRKFVPRLEELERTYRRVAIDHKGRGGMKEESVVSVALAS